MLNDLILTSLQAHFKYVYPRIHEKEKQRGFKATITFLSGKLEHYPANKVMSLPEVVNYVMLNYGDSYFGYKAGANLAIDIFKEICDNINARYNTGYTSDTTVTRIL